MFVPDDAAKLRDEFDPPERLQVSWRNYFGRKKVRFHQARGELEVDHLVRFGTSRTVGVLLLIIERLDTASTEALVGFIGRDRSSRNGPSPSVMRIPIENVHPFSHGGPDHEVADRS